MELSDKPIAPVSVVIPTYRASKTLLEAVDSVAGQTMLPMEVIVVDDGSNDGTLDRMRALASRYPTGWLKVIALDDNRGAGSARNAGWSVARGQFIAFLDADDAWHPRKIEYQYSYLRDKPDVVLCGHGFQFMGCVDKEPPLALGAAQISSFRLVLSNPFVTPSVMLRTELPFRFKSGKRHMEDHLLWMEIGLAKFKVVRLSAPLALIRKPQFGESGLSADLWAMEMGELHNYWSLGKNRQLGWLVVFALMIYSMGKYARRLIIVAARRACIGGGKKNQVPTR